MNRSSSTLRSSAGKVATLLRHLVTRCTSLDVLSIMWLLIPSLRPLVLCGLTLVVDGAVRDVDFIRDLEFPVFSAEVCFVSAKTAQVPAADVPATVTVGAVEVEPGDWIFGDGDGMLAIKRRFVSAVINGALLLLAEEEALKAALVRGDRFGDLCGLGDHLAGRGPLRFDP